ncbi:hypothetical protein V8C40DRAFT_236079 [Trichoderma camerunense]
MIMVTQHRTIVLFICFVKQADIDRDFELVPSNHPEFTCLLAEYNRSTWVLIAFTNDGRYQQSFRQVSTCITR